MSTKYNMAGVQFQSTPSEGRATPKTVISRFTALFQSTPSEGRATPHQGAGGCSTYHFNPRPPRGGRHGQQSCFSFPSNFNPRPPRGGRLIGAVLHSQGNQFQSTPSEGRATLCQDHLSGHLSISIHALRGEGDWDMKKHDNVSTISIHALRGEGDSSPQQPKRPLPISIHALRGEGDNDRFFLWKTRTIISIHALRGEGDNRLRYSLHGESDFNPRPPRGGRRPRFVLGSSSWNFNPRPPRGGRLSISSPITSQENFNPRPPRGGRPML